MPAVSKKQFKFFQYLGHNPEAAREHGFTEHKAKEYVSHNTGSKSYSKLPEVVKAPKVSSPEIAPPMKRFHSLFNKK